MNAASAAKYHRLSDADGGRDLSDPRWEENTKALAAAMAQIERALAYRAPAQRVAA